MFLLGDWTEVQVEIIGCLYWESVWTEVQVEIVGSLYRETV